MSITPESPPPVAPKKDNAASSSPEQISSMRPVSFRSRAEKSAWLAASRVALVAKRWMASAPSRRAESAIFFTAAQEEAIAWAERLRFSSSPAKSRVPSLSRRMRRISPPSTSHRSILTEFEPIPITATFISPSFVTKRAFAARKDPR